MVSRRWLFIRSTILYLYVTIAARVYLLRWYARNAWTDLTDEKKQLRQIEAI
jgi:hypothetical protein